MKIWLSASVFALILSLSASPVIYRDHSGRVTGTATNLNGETTYHDRTGRITGRTTRNGSTTTYRDQTGRTTGYSSSQEPPETGIPADSFYRVQPNIQSR